MRETDDAGRIVSDVLITGHTLYAAPHRMRLPNGELGPEYGARDVHAMARLDRKYRFSIVGGGFWDEEQIVRTSSRRQRAQEQRAVLIPREDADAMAKFMGAHSHQVSRQEQAVYVMLYVDAHSISYATRELSRLLGGGKGVSRNTVRTYLRRLRLRLARKQKGERWED